jgi:hypothetical protein
MHPAERELRKVHQLTPALRELVAKMARSIAKDFFQDMLERHDLVALSKDAPHPQGVAKVPCTRDATCPAANCENYCGTIQPRRPIQGITHCGQLKCPVCTERDPNGTANTRYTIPERS